MKRCATATQIECTATVCSAYTEERVVMTRQTVGEDLKAYILANARKALMTSSLTFIIIVQNLL
jgi:hypothetical protein